MKKFTKLGLVLIAVLSFLCFLVYKLRYDRLYNVMQVLEVFGSPPQPSKCVDPDSLDLLIPTLPAPSWKSIGTDVYGYSAHCSGVPGETALCSLVSVLAVMRGKVEFSGFTCKLWYEGSMNPIPGTFSYRTEKEDTEFTVLTLSCETKFPTKVPYGVSILEANSHETLSEIIPVYPVVSASDPKINLQVCVLPPTHSEDHAPALKESILFHTLLGVSSFILFSPAFPHSFILLANKLQAQLNIKIQMYPWNPPLGFTSSLENHLVTTSCFQHSRYSENYVLLQDNQILMPRIGENITKVLLESKLDTGPNPLSVRRFCSEYPNDKKSANLAQPISVLQSTYFNKQLSDGVQTNIFHSGAGQPLPAFLSGEVYVNEYGPCDKYDFSETDHTAGYDQTALKFSHSIKDLFKRFNPPLL